MPKHFFVIQIIVIEIFQIFHSHNTHYFQPYCVDNILKCILRKIEYIQMTLYLILQYFHVVWTWKPEKDPWRSLFSSLFLDIIFVILVRFALHPEKQNLQLSF